MKHQIMMLDVFTSAIRSPVSTFTLLMMLDVFTSAIRSPVSTLTF